MQLPLAPPLRAIVERERTSISLHRETLRGSEFPRATGEHAPTFLHGFLLPFSLLATTLRHPVIGWTFLKVTVVRAFVIGLLGFALFATARFHPTEEANHHREEHVTESPGKASVTFGPGVGGVKWHRRNNGREVNLDGTELVPEPEPTSFVGRAWKTMTGGWAWLVWFVSLLSIVEACVVVLSRRYDDWIAYHVASLARIRSDDPFPIPPRLVLFDRRWLWKKAFRRARGYAVIFAGLPLFMLFRLIPVYGDILFAISSLLWSWYWLGVFTASKSGHAWIDEAIAPSPYLIRELRDRSTSPLLAPVKLYARLWAWITRGVNAPAMTFERCPAPFLGLGLARAILSLPGLYQFGRAAVPVAAGRLCAEIDPQRRFSL